MFFRRSSEAVSIRHQSFETTLAWLYLTETIAVFMLLRFLMFGRFTFTFGSFLCILNSSLEILEILHGKTL